MVVRRCAKVTFSSAESKGHSDYTLRVPSHLTRTRTVQWCCSLSHQRPKEIPFGPWLSLTYAKSVNLPIFSALVILAFH